MRKYAGDILNIVWQTEDNLMPDISRLTLTRARHICDPGADIGPWSQDTVRIMNRSGHWAESRGKVNLYIIRTTLSSQYTWVRPEARYLYTPEQVCAGTSSHIVERGDLQKDCLFEMLSFPHRLSAGTNSKKCFYSISLSRRAHHLKSQMGLDTIRLLTLQDFVWEMIDWDVKFKTSEMTEFWLLSAFIVGLLTSNL